MPRRHRSSAIAVLCGAVACSGLGRVSAQAAILHAGQGEKYASPSAAIAAAHDGDTVLIAPGTYYDCAIVGHNDLTIAGSAPGVVLTDKTCAGKALLVIDGHNVTVRNLTLTRARVPDANGAGIRAEGHNLTVDNVRFINNQEGILAAADPDGTITVRNSLFERNALCEPNCGFDIEVGSLGLLRVANSSFEESSGGIHIFSAAQKTELVGNQLTDAGIRAAAPAVSINGGALTLLDNRVALTAGAHRPGAVLITGDATRITVRGNALHEPDGQGVPLLRNWTGQTAETANNTVPPGAAAVSDSGGVYHRLRAQLAVVRNSLLGAARTAKHLAGAVLARVK